MPDAIVTRAPTRIDFGGGWTDVPPYSDEQGGFVCSVAIARYATVSATRGDPANTAASCPLDAGDRAIIDAAVRRCGVGALHVASVSDFPIGAGLGGSSAVGVAVVAALAAASRTELSRTAIAELSREIEIGDLGIAGGRQDHYAAAYGGALGLRFSEDGVDVRRIPLPPETRSAIERRCLVIYTGKSRISGDTINAVLGAYRRGDAAVLDALQQMKDSAERMCDALAAGDIDALGALVREQWLAQRSLHPAIRTPLIDEIIARATAAGALGAKALGASGGGCVLVIAPDGGEAVVRTAIAPLGELLDYTIDECGVVQCP